MGEAVNGGIILKGEANGGAVLGGGDCTAPLHVTAGMLEPDKWDV